MIFIISAVLYNLVVLGISWGVASGGTPDNPHPPENDFILALLVIATVLINFFIIKESPSIREDDTIEIVGWSCQNVPR